MEHEIITKQEAIERGLARYFPNKRCRNGHLSEWFTKGRCCQCTLESTAAIRKRKAKGTGKATKKAKGKAVAIIPPNKLYDGGELPKWMARYGEGIRNDMVAIEDFYIAAAAKIAKVKGASTPRGFKKFLEEFGIGRTRAYELLAIADGRTTIAEVRESGRVRQKRFYEERKARPPLTDKSEVVPPKVIEGKAIEVTPPTVVATEPAHSLEERDHLGRDWHEERTHLMRSVREIHLYFGDIPPEEVAAMILQESDLPAIEMVAAFLTALAEAMRRKAEAA